MSKPLNKELVNSKGFFLIAELEDGGDRANYVEIIKFDDESNRGTPGSRCSNLDIETYEFMEKNFLRFTTKP